jgi:hypothetical protein
MARNAVVCLMATFGLWAYEGCAYAGAWTQKAGGSYVKIAAAYLNSGSAIDSDGNRVPKAGMGELRDVNLSAYVEYGFTDHLTLVGSMPYKRLKDVRTFANGRALERRTGFGDLELRLRWRIVSEPAVVSVAVGGKVPMWYADDPQSRVPLSSRKVDGDVRILVGRSLYPFPGYVTGEAGFRARAGGFGNEIIYGLEAGVTAGRLLVKGFVSGIQTLGECAPTGEVGLVGDQSVLKLSPGFIFRVRDWLELSAEVIHVAWGCNTSAGNTYLLGVALKR